ncbi:MAG: hypothetical protein ABI895_18680 [Deltaproteobacteria bacterium]
MTIESDDSGPLQLNELYRPPAADEAPLPSPAPNAPFYVVSRTKFLVLFFATFGAYQLYWFFTNWQRYRDRTRTSLYPFWRAVFSPLFTHKLFGIVAQHGKPPAPRFPAQEMATLYVVFVVGSWVLDRWGGSLLIDVVSTALGLCTAYPLLAAQDAANAASGDPGGSSNSRMSPLNYVFIVLGVVLWPLLVLGLVMPAE